MTEDEKEIRRLRYELEVTRNVIALYGNGMLSAAHVLVEDLGSVFHNQMKEVARGGVNSLAIHQMDVELLGSNAYYHVRCFSSAQPWDARGMDLTKYRLVLAMVKINE